MTAETAELVQVGQYSIYQSSDARAQLEEAKARAAVLVEVIKEQGLARSFGGGRPHVQVEGWSFLGSQFGLIPDIEWTKELDNGWEARAAIVRLSDGVAISHGEAECRRSEGNWKNRDSYAIRSMAQTRAISKAFRNCLSSVMVMAGYAATPAEEMDGIRTERPQAAEPVSTGDPHCPACLAVNGELVGVFYNTKKPFWKCKNPADKCAGSETDKNGKAWAWSGWHENWQTSADEWLHDHGYEGVVTSSQPTVDAGEWLAVSVKAFSKWSDEQRRQAYKAVMEELHLTTLEDLDMAKAIYEGMAAAYYTEFPDLSPF